ncbi:MAG: hypothetical protein Q8N96_04050, partial [Methylovulum sp.]|nr:hypothetical protein [Methylovulum sp.]
MKSINYQKWVKILGLMSLSLIFLVVHADVNAAQQKNQLKPKHVTSFKQLKRMLNAKRVHANNYLVFKSDALA